jgi:ABC-type branched-subunit amino acid transport system ATPase component/ABC-type branched-subunit amino acid transport system permease subunit
VSEKGFRAATFAPAIFVLVCIGAGSFLGSYPQYALAMSLVAMVIGVALIVLVGLARCISLASGSIMAIGAYTSTLLMVHFDVQYVVGIALAMITGAAAGWLIALPGTRFRGHNLAMVTLVFQSVCIILLREAKTITGGAEGIHVPAVGIFGWRIESDGDYLLIIGLVSALSILGLTILIRGSFGKNLQAVASNEVAAEAYGIGIPDYLTAAFVVSSIAIALAGALAAPRIRILDPDSFGVLSSIFMLAYPIVGGMHSVWGGVLGGGGLRSLPELLRPVADYQELFFASLVILVVMFFPGGLVELVRRASTLVMRDRGKRDRRDASTAHPREAMVSTAQQVQSSEPLLCVEGIDKHFGALHAVDAASLQVPVGGIHGLIGPNGAGKTSLFNIISGFLAADAGRIAFAGNSLLELQSRDRIRFGITRTFQHVAVFGQLSCLDNVIIGLGRNQVLNSMRESLDRFLSGRRTAVMRRQALAALAAVSLAEDADAPAAALSLGNQRLLEIARAMVSEPKLILLDEPASGISEQEGEQLLKLLLRINSERNIAMLVIEHNIPFIAKLCRTMSVMGAGRIVAQGRPADVISLPVVRRLYFGEEIEHALQR